MAVTQNDIMNGLRQKGIETKQQWYAKAGVSKKDGNILETINATRHAGWFIAKLCAKDRASYLRCGTKYQARFTKQLCPKCKEHHAAYLDTLRKEIEKQYGKGVEITQ